MNHFITLAEAVDMTSRYRSNYEQILNSTYQGQGILPLSETIERAAIDRLLSESGCERLRIYYGMDQDYKVHAVLVAVDSNNQDILPAANSVTLDEEPVIVDRTMRCPDICPEPSDLNG